MRNLVIKRDAWHLTLGTDGERSTISFMDTRGDILPKDYVNTHFARGIACDLSWYFYHLDDSSIKGEFTDHDTVIIRFGPNLMVELMRNQNAQN